MDEKKKVLTLDDIRAVKDMSPFPVECPEWGGVVKVRPLSIRERTSIMKLAEEPSKDPDGKWTTILDDERLQVECVIVGSVEPKFTPECRDWLAKEKSGIVVGRIARAVLGASGQGEEEGKN